MPLLGFAVTFRSNVTILSPKVDISYKMWWFSSTCCHRMPIRSPLLRMQGLWRVHERCACHSDRASFGSCKEGRKKSWSSMKGALDHLDFGHENRCYFWQTLQLDPALVWPVSSCEPSAGLHQASRWLSKDSCFLHPVSTVFPTGTHMRFTMRHIFTSCEQFYKYEIASGWKLQWEWLWIVNCECYFF